MDSMSYKIDGLKELKAVIKRMNGNVGSDRLGQAIMAGAYVVEREAKKLAPVDTGFLRSSIRASLVMAGLTQAEADIVAQAFYAVFVEMGTRFMSAQPFLRPALDYNHESIAQAVAIQLKNAILEGLGQ